MAAKVHWEPVMVARMRSLLGPVFLSHVCVTIFTIQLVEYHVSPVDSVPLKAEVAERKLHAYSGVLEAV